MCSRFSDNYRQKSGANISKQERCSAYCRVTRVVFLKFLIELKFSRVVIVCICWDTPSGQNDLWQLPTVSSVSKWWCTCFSINIYVILLLHVTSFVHGGKVHGLQDPLYRSLVRNDPSSSVPSAVLFKQIIYISRGAVLEIGPGRLRGNGQ